MNILKKVIPIAVLLILLIAIIGWFIPRNFSLERSIDINTPAAPIYDILITPKKSNEWSPWARIDPEGTTYTYEGHHAGEGAIMKWSSDNSDVGSGTQTWEKCIHNKRVVSKLEFDGFDAPSYATLILEEVDGYTEVTWQFETDFGPNPFAHYFSFLMGSELGDQYEKGLNNLKEYVEALGVEEEELDIELEGDALVDSLSHIQEEIN